MIRVLKLLVSTSSNLDDVLNKALQEAAQRLAQQQDFAKAIDSFQSQLLQDLELVSGKAQSYFTRLMKDMESVVETWLSKVLLAFKNVETDITSLGQVCCRLSGLIWTVLIQVRSYGNPIMMRWASIRASVGFSSKYLRAARKWQLARQENGKSAEARQWDYEIH